MQARKEAKNHRKADNTCGREESKNTSMLFSLPKTSATGRGRQHTLKLELRELNQLFDSSERGFRKAEYMPEEVVQQRKA